MFHVCYLLYPMRFEVSGPQNADQQLDEQDVQHASCCEPFLALATTSAVVSVWDLHLVSLQQSLPFALR